MHLRLVVDAVQTQSAGKVDQRLLFAYLAKHVCGGLQRGELPVSVEDVELAIVLPEGRARIGAAGVVRCAFQPLAFANHHGFQNAQQPIAVGRKVLQDVHRSALVAHDRHQVHGRHLRANEFFRSFERAHLVGGRQRGHIEIQGQQPLIFVALVVHGFRRNGLARQLVIDRNVLTGRVHRRQRLGGFGQILMLAEFDRLGDAVFRKHKIFGRESANEVTLLILDLNSFDHQIRLHLDRKILRLTWTLILAHLLRTRACDGHEKNCEDRQCPHHCHLRWNVVCRLRMPPVDVGLPNCVLSKFHVVFQPVNAAWLKVLVAFTLTSRYHLPCGRKVRAIDVSKVN